MKVTCPWVPEGRGFLEYLKGEWTLVAPGNIMRFPFPPFILGPYWDGIPAAGNAVFPMGLFRDVKLVASGSVVVDDLFVTTKSLNADGTATLGVSGTIENYGDQDVAATLDLKIAPDNFAGGTARAAQAIVERPSGSQYFHARGRRQRSSLVVDVGSGSAESV